MTTGRWLDPDIPKRDWEVVFEYSHPLPEDWEPGQGVPRGPNPCQMCLKEYPLHIDVVRHDDWPEDLHVGCDCSGYLTETLDETRKRFQRRMRERATERRREKEKKAEAERLEKARIELEKIEKRLKPRRDAIATARKDNKVRTEIETYIRENTYQWAHNNKGYTLAIPTTKDGGGPWFTIVSYQHAADKARYYWIDETPNRQAYFDGDKLRIYKATTDEVKLQRDLVTAITACVLCDDLEIPEAMTMLTGYVPESPAQIRARKAGFSK